MAIELLKNEDIKVVTKPWGYEKWLQPGNQVYPFVLKELLLRQGQKTSLQVHQVKSETILILSGSGYLLTYDGDFDSKKYVSGQYSQQDLFDIVNSLIRVTLYPGLVFHTPPNTIHRMVAEEDLLYIEASTTELDDVIRLQDDNNRVHGRIESEHK
jgi:mannose-6-phosphate isomerase-like protein (cupin superfamily)